MKKSSVLKISIIALAVILLMQVSAFAYNIALKTSTDNTKYDLDKEITLTVNWGEKLQAVGFTINYDKTKVKFVNSPDIAETFYNSDTEGKVDVNWASMDGKEPTQMVFKFKAIGEGEAKFTISNADKDKFSNGELEAPEILDTTKGEVTVTINKKTTEPEQKKTEEKQPEQPEQPEQPKQPTKKDNTTAGGKMPQTGIDDTTILTILVLAVVGTIGYIGYKKLSDI